jgi:excisionase family DNA binding protein
MALTAKSRDQVREDAQRQTMTNVENLAKAIGVGKNSIYDAIARGDWTATRVLRVGRRILIPTADILALVSPGIEPISNEAA